MSGAGEPAAGESAEPTHPVCGSCGRTADADASVLLTWSMAVEGGRTSWTCPDCARRHVRSIEGKLDSAWW